MQKNNNGEAALDHDLTALLDDVYAGTVTDSDDQLLGLLLTRLYPGTLQPAEVGRYLRQRKKRSFMGSYVHTTVWASTSYAMMMATDQSPASL